MAVMGQDYVEAGMRWQARADAIRRTESDGPAVDTAARKDAYLQHQLETAGGEAMWAGTRAPPLDAQPGLERIIGENDMISIDTLQRAIAIGRFVCLISRRENQYGPADDPVPLATGSMVSPRLLLTNNHVIGTHGEARASVAKFDFQHGEDDTPRATSTFELRPDEFFLTDEALDYTLVAVATTAQEGTPLSHFGWNKLIGAQGKILKGHPVNIIQHPEGGYKHIVLSGSKVLELHEYFFLYDADTLPGSSGAPVFNQQWELVALHRRSVPKVIDRQIMTRGGQKWNPSIPESQIEWVGNEGTRVSSLVAHLNAARLDGGQALLRRELIDRPAPNPFLVSRQSLSQYQAPPVASAAQPALGNDGTFAFNVPLELHISISNGSVSDPSPLR